MTPVKLNVMFAFYSYGGNGGVSMSHPSIRAWFAKTVLAAKADERVGDIKEIDYSDTPITMMRNRAVQDARKFKSDILIMVDSDQHPDLYVGQDQAAKPFWDTSFNFLYDHYSKGPVVIGAPYGGPPPWENVYVFKWSNRETDTPDYDYSVEQFTREEASIRAGIEPCAALPTGLIMFDMRAFDLVKPPYFYYEYTDEYQQEKASTEDVTCTRDIGLAGQQILGYSPIHVNWDAWAGHYKPKCVGKPKLLSITQVNEKYRDAVHRNKPATEKLVFLRQPASVERLLAAHGNGK